MLSLIPWQIAGDIAQSHLHTQWGGPFSRVSFTKSPEWHELITSAAGQKVSFNLQMPWYQIIYIPWDRRADSTMHSTQDITVYCYNQLTLQCSPILHDIAYSTVMTNTENTYMASLRLMDQMTGSHYSSHYFLSILPGTTIKTALLVCMNAIIGILVSFLLCFIMTLNYQV